MRNEIKDANVENNEVQEEVIGDAVAPSEPLQLEAAETEGAPAEETLS